MKLIMEMDYESITKDDLIIAIKSQDIFRGVNEVKSKLFYALNKGFLWYRNEPIDETEEKLIEKIIELIGDECDIKVD